MEKDDEVVGMIIEARDLLEDILDILVPPPVEERLELAMSEAPPERGVAEVVRGASIQKAQKLRKRA